MWEIIKKILLLPWALLVFLITAWFYLGLFLLGIGVLIILWVLISTAVSM